MVGQGALRRAAEAIALSVIASAIWSLILAMVDANWTPLGVDTGMAVYQFFGVARFDAMTFWVLAGVGLVGGLVIVVSALRDRNDGFIPPLGMLLQNVAMVGAGYVTAVVVVVLSIEFIVGTLWNLSEGEPLLAHPVWYWIVKL